MVDDGRSSSSEGDPIASDEGSHDSLGPVIEALTETLDLRPQRIPKLTSAAIHRAFAARPLLRGAFTEEQRRCDDVFELVGSPGRPCSESIARGDLVLEVIPGRGPSLAGVVEHARGGTLSLVTVDRERRPRALHISRHDGRIAPEYMVLRLRGLTPGEAPAPAPAASACGTQARPPFDPQRLRERRGELEHLLVQIEFMGQAGRVPRAEYSIPGASKKGTGHTGYADIVDLGSKEVFEIKPEHLVAMAQAEAAHYAAAINSTCGQGTFRAGTSYKPPKKPIWEFRSGSTYVRLIASFGGQGAVLYRWDWGGLKTKWSDEWVKIFARSLALKDLFGRDLLDASGNVVQGFGQGKEPVLETFGYARVAQAAVQTLDATLRANKNFFKGIAHDIGQRAAALSGSKIVMYMPEEAFALSAAGQAIVATHIQAMQVQTNPQVNAYRAMLDAVIMAMGVGYLIGITGAVGFAWAGGTATTMSAMAATASTMTTTAPAWAPALKSFGEAMAGATAGTMLLFWPDQAAAQPTIHSGGMQYVVVPPLQAISSIPGAATINGVKHVQIGVATVP